MGMFDYVRCKFPLPHHQDAEFQTKDLLRLVDPDEWLGGLMDHYMITKAGRLRRQMHKYKIVKGPRRFPSFYLKSTKAWWVASPGRTWRRGHVHERGNSGHTRSSVDRISNSIHRWPGSTSTGSVESLHDRRMVHGTPSDRHEPADEDQTQSATHSSATAADKVIRFRY
jgi:hypothetical protein